MICRFESMGLAVEHLSPLQPLFASMDLGLKGVRHRRVVCAL